MFESLSSAFKEDKKLEERLKTSITQHLQSLETEFKRYFPGLKEQEACFSEDVFLKIALPRFWYAMRKSYPLAVAYAGFWKGGGARNFRKFERSIDQNLKSSQSNFVPFFAQNQVISSPKPDAQLAKEGAVPQFCSLFYAILQSWRPKGGPWPNGPPLNTPLPISIRTGFSNISSICHNISPRKCQNKSSKSKESWWWYEIALPNTKPRIPKLHLRL